jgi:hypothetical protein
MPANQFRNARAPLIASSVAAALVLTATFAPQQAGAQEPASASGPHILISDQFNNRVIEVDPATHHVVWSFGDGSDKPGPASTVGPNDAERFGPYTLISGTGIPASSPALPGCSDPVNGCPDNRVFVVGPGGHILWQYG